MPPEATKEWLALLERRARDRNVPHEIRPNIRYFHFRIGKDPAVVGKVRISERKKRDYEDEQGEKYIWHRYNRETEAIEENKNQDEDRDIVNITLDVWEKDEYDPNKSHFIFLTEELLINETHSQGDQRIGVEGDGQYSGPLAKYVDDWDALFDYAMNNKTSTQSGSQPQPDQDTNLSGSVVQTKRNHVSVSEGFKQDTYERFDYRCPLSGIEKPALLTISHVLSRSDHPELAEDIKNVMLLDWTHHMAFDAALWTFDELGRIWIKKGLDTESDTLRSSLISRHGEKSEKLSLVSDNHIDRHNDDLNWWPPQ